jgi:hypothetical protein
MNFCQKPHFLTFETVFYTKSIATEPFIQKMKRWMTGTTTNNHHSVITTVDLLSSLNELRHTVKPS